VRVDLNARHAYVKEFTNGTLHAFQIFHTFSGSRFNQPASSRDWAVTSVVGARDGRAGCRPDRRGRGKLYMWWMLKKRRTFGFIVLAGGRAELLGVLLPAFL
jgi:hypothetical protein